MSTAEVSVLNLILSHSASSARETRDLIRSKWLSRDHEGYRHLFVLGGSGRPGRILADELHLPSNDTYKGGPAKVIDALAYVVEHDAEVGIYTYYLKSDDDTLVCVSQLVRWLRMGNLPLHRAYAGQPQTYLVDLRTLAPTDKFNDDNYIKVFGQYRYRPYMLGGGYVMSRDTVQHVVSEGRRLGFLEEGKWRAAGVMPYMEDAFIGAIVGDFADHFELPVSASSFQDNYKLDIRYPENFCIFLAQPKVLCNHVRGRAWCQEYNPLVMVHPVEIITGNATRIRKLSPAWRLKRHAKLVSNASTSDNTPILTLNMPRRYRRRHANATEKMLRSA